MPAIRPTLTCAFMVVKSQKHGITRSYSRRNCAPGRADTLFSAVRQYAYALPSGRVRLESRPGGPLLQESAAGVLPQAGVKEPTMRRNVSSLLNRHPGQTQSRDLVLGWLVPWLRSLFLTEGCFAFCASFFDSRTTSA